MTDSIVPQQGGADNRPSDRDSPISAVLAAARAVVASRVAASGLGGSVLVPPVLHDAIDMLSHAIEAFDHIEENRIAGMTKEQQLQLRGLMMMAEELNASLARIEKSALLLTCEGASGHTSDAVYGQWNFEELMERLIYAHEQRARRQEQGDEPDNINII